MSAAQSQLDNKPFPAHHLHLDAVPSSSPVGAEEQLSCLVHHRSSDNFGPDKTQPAPLHHLALTGDCPPSPSLYQLLQAQMQMRVPVQGEPPLTSISTSTSTPTQQDYGYAPAVEAKSESQQHPAPSPLQIDLTSAPSLPAHPSALGGGLDSPPRGMMTMCSSDAESPSSQPQSDPLDANGNPSEAIVSHDFGLASNGPPDGSDLGFKRKEDKNGHTPTWSELKTKAGKDRKRLPMACLACRRKKTKCSGEKPSCKHCIRSKVPCIYKENKRKAAPRTDYMTMLDKRLKRMEERIIKIIPKDEPEKGPPSVPRANVKPVMPGSLGSGKASRKREADVAFGLADDQDSWAKALTKTNVGSPTQATLFNESEERQLLQEGLEALPPKDIQEHLAGVFFDNVYGQAYHVLHQPSYMRKLSADELPPVLILSVCAVSARFSRHPKLNTEPTCMRGEEWADVALDIVKKRCERPNITVLTCLLLLGLHSFGTCHGNRSWSLGGQAIRMAFALQLHKDLDYDPQKPGIQLTFVDREIRRRTMWACFMMDRFGSSGTDRPTFIKDEFLKIPLPVDEKNFRLDMPAPTENLFGEVPDAGCVEEGEKANAKENMGVAAYMVKTISIWGRAITYLNQGGRETDAKALWEEDSEYSKLVKEAEDMANSLPVRLQYNPENLRVHETERMVNQFVFLHVAIQQNILFLNRLAVTPDSKSHQNIPTAFVTKAGQRAFAAANRISDLLKESETYHNINAPFLGYCAFLSSTVHIFGITSGNNAIEAESTQHLDTNIRFFRKMKEPWGFFIFILQTLRQQYRKSQDDLSNGRLSELSSTPIFQYGDWFDRYPNGLSESDWADPASLKKKEKGEDGVLEQKPKLQTVEEFITEVSPQPRGGPPSKRKTTLAAKRESSTSFANHHGHPLQPLMTELIPDQMSHFRQRQHGNHYFNGNLGAQTSGAVAFSGPSSVQHANPFPTVSPISPAPVNHNQFAGHQHGLYNGMYSMQPAEQNMMPTHQPLGHTFDTPQGIDHTAAAALLGGLAGWSNGDHGGVRENSRGNGAPPHGAGPDASHGNPHHTVYGPPHSNSWLNLQYGMVTPEAGEVGGMGTLDFGGIIYGNAAGNRVPGGQ